MLGPKRHCIDCVPSNEGVWLCHQYEVDCGHCVLLMQTVRRLQVTESELERAEERASAAETYAINVSV